jgi:hypothetical protein
MEDKDKNQMDNSQNLNIGGMPPQNPDATQENPSVVNTSQPSNSNIEMPTPAQPAQNISPIPTPPPPNSNGKSSTLIVGGILLLFIIIVVALYFLILRQSYEPEVQITPPPIQQTEPASEASPTPANAEEQEIIDIDIEENLDEEFVPIDQDLNSL